MPTQVIFPDDQYDPFRTYIQAIMHPLTEAMLQYQSALGASIAAPITEAMMKPLRIPAMASLASFDVVMPKLPALDAVMKSITASAQLSDTWYQAIVNSVNQQSVAPSALEALFTQLMTAPVIDAVDTELAELDFDPRFLVANPDAASVAFGRVVVAIYQTLGPVAEPLVRIVVAVFWVMLISRIEFQPAVDEVMKHLGITAIMSHRPKDAALSGEDEDDEVDVGYGE